MPSPSPDAERRPPSARANFAAEVCRARPLLGTLVEIRAAAPDSRVRLDAAIDTAFAAVERVQELMSCHDPGSELSRLNREAACAEQRIHPQTYAVIEFALHMAALSNGAFDPCIGEHLERWGYLPPTASARGPPRAFAGIWRDVQLIGPDRVRFARPLRLDLGGIAKGYAVDCAVQALQRAGVEKILVNAGGDLRIAGPWEQRVRLRHPEAPHLGAELLTLRDAALATSAAYFSRRRLAIGEVSALLDPPSAQPYLGHESVSVRAADCMSADALTKVVLFAPPKLAESALAAHRAQACVLTPAAATG